MNKRGFSEAVAFVLLVGFAIGSGVMVFSWLKGHTETLTESTVTYAEGKLECSEISFNVFDKTNNCLNYQINNIGKLMIDKISFINLDNEGNDLEVTPIVEISNKLIGCNDKKIIIPNCGYRLDLESELNNPNFKDIKNSIMFDMKLMPKEGIEQFIYSIYDYDYDNDIDTYDKNKLNDVVLRRSDCPNNKDCDLNNSGKVTNADVTLLVILINSL